MNKPDFRAASGNSGNFSQTRFSAVPELALEAGYQINRLARADDVG